MEDAAGCVQSSDRRMIFSKWDCLFAGTESALAGAFAGLVSSVVTCPLDVVKTKLQAEGFLGGKNPRYRGLFGTLFTLSALYLCGTCLQVLIFGMDRHNCQNMVGRRRKRALQRPRAYLLRLSSHMVNLLYVLRQSQGVCACFKE